MPKIPCPSCREPNFDTDIVCWKCGEPLRKADEPDVYQPKQIVQVDVSAPSGLADAPIPVSTPELVLAMLMGAVTGALISLLINTPFLLWIKASYIPSSEAIPFIRWMVVAGAVAGAASVTSRYGIIAGFLVYEAAYVAILVYAETVQVVMPPSLDHLFSRRNQHGLYYPVGGLICSYLGLLGARLAFRCLRRSAPLPARSGSGTYAEREQMNALTAVALLSLLAFAFDAWGYAEEIGKALSSPKSVAMRYCEAMASSPSGDLSRVQPMLMKGLTERLSRDPSARSSLNPSGILSSREVVDQIRQRRVLSATEDVDPIYRTAEVDIEVRGPAISGADGAESTGQPIHLFFELGYSKGKWMVAQPPRYLQADQ